MQEHWPGDFAIVETNKTATLRGETQRAFPSTNFEPKGCLTLDPKCHVDTHLMFQFVPATNQLDAQHE